MNINSVVPSLHDILCSFDFESQAQISAGSGKSRNGWTSAKSICPVRAASSTGRCNTIDSVDSAMLLQENHLVGCIRSIPSQGSVPAGLTLKSGVGFCFQCQGVQA